MDTVIQVQIPDTAVYILYCVYTLKKGIIVEQTGFFNLGMVTSLEERKFQIQKLHLKCEFVSHLAFGEGLGKKIIYIYMCVWVCVCIQI